MAQGKDRGEGTWMPDDIGGLPSRELSLAEKVILSRIISLSVGRPCEMSNAGFASRFGISTRQVTNHIKSLQEKAWIEVMGPRTKRYIKPTEKALSLWKKPSIEETDYRRNLLEKKTSSTIEETFPNYRRNLLPKNTENTKNTSICANADLRKSTPSQKGKREKFVPPSLDEVEQYVEEKKLAIDARRFLDFYTAGKWHDSNGKPVRNWKQKALTWDRREQENRKNKPPVSPPSAWGGIPIVGSASDETEEERRARVEAAIQEQQANTRANN